MKKILPIFVLCISFYSCKEETQSNDIPVISVKENKEVKEYVSSKILVNKLNSLSNNLTTSTLETLNNLPEVNLKTPWQLSRVSVGLGLETEVELAEDLFETELEANIEFRFQKF